MESKQIIYVIPLLFIAFVFNNKQTAVGILQRRVFGEAWLLQM